MAEETESSMTVTQKTVEEDLEKLTIAEGEESKKVKMITSDNVTFVVESSIAEKMETVQTFIEDLGTAAADSVVIPLPNVTSRDLGRILEYCLVHCRVDAGACNLKEFDEQFVKDLTTDDLKELLLAANYLNIKILLDFLSSTIANVIKNKDVEFVRIFFGIVSDYTAEEEAKYRQENAWAFQNIEQD